MHSCLLVGGAPTDHKGLDKILKTCRFDAIYAIDGGYEPLRARGIKPDGVFGDFDSLGYVPLEGDARAAEHPACDAESGAVVEAAAVEKAAMQVEVFNSHKDFTDMDWAINHAMEIGFTNIVVCEGLSKRLDHSLGNLQLMAAAASNGQRVWGITEEEVVLTLDSAGGLMEVSIDPGATGTCSVISHSDNADGIFEDGLEYSLVNAHVTNRALWGISNELIGKPARISLRQGSLWVFLPLTELEKISYARIKLATK